MTITGRQVLDNIEQPSEQKALQFQYAGLLVLVAGSATEQLPAGISGAAAIVQRLVAGGAPGHYTAIYDVTTGVLTVTSSSGTDTSQLVYFLVR